MAERSGYVYLLRASKPFEERDKIGRTAHPKQRLRAFGVRLPYRVEVLMMSKVGDCFEAEETLHRQYSTKRLDGEWFNLCPEDVQEILLTALCVEAQQLASKPANRFTTNLDEMDVASARRAVKALYHATKRLDRRCRSLMARPSKESVT